ncbi:hypothetical protein H920_15199 [Fukomys damarensis]|uniref:Uncharacterized protein n=1 Tax=Fukomys damarensis TaxID=885580 RepID=A0A091CV25_FUKDA|nr:hypothetical protein H920_15199 [Fukomys damarensis]
MQICNIVACSWTASLSGDSTEEREERKQHSWKLGVMSTCQAGGNPCTLSKWLGKGEEVGTAGVTHILPVGMGMGTTFPSRDPSERRSSQPGSLRSRPTDPTVLGL